MYYILQTSNRKVGLTPPMMPKCPQVIKAVIPRTNTYLIGYSEVT